MDGTNPLILSKVGLINRTHVFVTPIRQYWPRLRYASGYPKPHIPRMIETDYCTGDDHVTLHSIDSWRVTSGVFDPFNLYAGVLSRNTTDNAQATQSVPGLQTNTTYQISLTGDATISFSGGTTPQYTWNNDNSQTSNNFSLSNNSATVVFSSDTPTAVSLKLNTSSQTVSKVIMTDSTGASLIDNNSFTTSTERFYAVEEWYHDSLDPDIIPTDTLGYLEGFNQFLLFTVFE